MSRRGASEIKRDKARACRIARIAERKGLAALSLRVRVAMQRYVIISGAAEMRRG